MTFAVEENENDTDNNYRSCSKRSVQYNKRFSEEEKKMSKSFDEWYKDQKEFQKEWAEQELGIVHCKDCKYFKFGNGCFIQSVDYDWEEQMYANDFCSRGEKKDE